MFGLISKSFQELRNFWTAKENESNSQVVHPSTATAQVRTGYRVGKGVPFTTESRPLSYAGSAQPMAEPDKAYTETKWKSETGLMDEDKGEKARPISKNIASVPLGETASLCSFRGSNRNIEYLSRNMHTISTQSISVSETQTKEQKNVAELGTDFRDDDKQSVASEPHVFTNSNQTSVKKRLYRRNDYKRSDNAPRKSSRPKSESGNEKALVRKRNDISAVKSETKERSISKLPVEREPTSSASQVSLPSIQNDEPFILETMVRSEVVDNCQSAPRNYVRIEGSSHVYVNTSSSAGPSIGSPSEKLSFGSFSSRAPTVSSGDSMSYSVRNTVAELTKCILDEHEASKTSVETKRLKEAKKKIQQNQFLILTGNNGEGLTTIGYDLLLDYPDRDKFIVMERKEALPCMTQAAGRPVIVLADDVFGTTYFDEKRFEGWCRIMSKIQKLIKGNKAILIMVINERFIKESKCNTFCDYYQDNILNISKPNLQLDFQEMNSILRANIMSQMKRIPIEICKTKGEENITRKGEYTCKNLLRISEQTIDEIARTALPSGFPGKVAHFLKCVDNIKGGLSFFTAPTMFEEIDMFRTSSTEEDRQKYLGLVAVLVYRSLNFDLFEIHCHYLAESERALRKYLASCSRGPKTLIQRTKCPDMINVLVGFANRFGLMSSLAGSVKKGVIMMLGIFVKEHMKGNYEIASLSVEKALAISCAKEFPIDVCKYSSNRVFNSVVGPDSAFDDTEIHISIKEKGKTCLAVMQRLKKLQVSNKLLEFIQHRAMQVPWFAKLYIKYLKKEKHALRCLIMSEDCNTGMSLISLSMKFPYNAPGLLNTQCLAEDLLISEKWIKIRKSHPSFAKEMEVEIIEKCCEMGWEESYFRLREKLQIFPQTKCLSQAVNSDSINILSDLSQHTLITLDDWYAALHQACKKLEENDSKTLEVIMYIQKIVPFEYQSDVTESIIHSAGRHGDDILLSKALVFYKDRNITNRDGRTCIHLATQGNHYYCVRHAIENGVSQKMEDPKGELALHYACILGFTVIVELLIKHDKEVVNCVSNSGSTPLHLSAEKGNLRISELLVLNGAFVNFTDKMGRKPTYYAARYGTLAVLNYLLVSEIDSSVSTGSCNSRNIREVETAQISKARQHILNVCLRDILCEILPDTEKIRGITYLLEKGANLNYVNDKGPPLLHLGIKENCSVEVIELLLNKGASVWQKSLETGDTALHVAVKHVNEKITKLILDNEGYNDELLRQRNKQNEMPLHIAADRGMVSIVRLLKSKSTISHFLVKEGRCFTPLALAQERRKQTSDRVERQKYDDVIQILSNI